MLYDFLVPLSSEIGFLNIFRYISFRSIGAILTALFVSFLIAPLLINFLKGFVQPIRKDGPRSHIFSKSSTPTMGGIVIMISSIISILLWTDLSNIFVVLSLLIMISFGFIGIVDDILKLRHSSSKGIRGIYKLGIELIIAFFVVYLFTFSISHEGMHYLSFPLFKDLAINLGIFYIPFAAFVISGSANAVNLTDGLDGLAIVPVMIAFACFSIISWISGHIVISEYLHLDYIEGSGELAILCASMVGSGMGFLWYNAPPAKIFMGDVGSLYLGSGLGAVAVFTRHEIVLALIGGLFVLETISVIVQVLSYKLTGRRIFRMAPLHHHYEEKGWAESTIVIRFWIIASILALLGLATLKIR